MTNDKPNDKEGGLRANAPKNTYRNDFTQEDWEKWAEEMGDKQASMPVQYMTISEIKEEFKNVLSADNLQALDQYIKKP